ncbi:enoyl-CoA hydratase/isomerase family protein [Alicyclobacillus ferrooxydans]|uniref:Enoyl-CoA hydratase n=1 Tax=Alicyclobacillus ferrooxydans TaxID=471514 RepID=A0A0P9CGS9_9BACL|nr:enoyl-CoA hydratase-related protein [Alicyclobacillus ferrooxydans]KPV44734.1 enoyl-CoA hydratase [Alicyclobacillus ferrooxydans]
MEYRTLQIEEREQGIVIVTLSNPPVNAMGEVLRDDLHQFTEETRQNKSRRVVVFKSDHPKIFLAGADLQGMSQGQTASPKEGSQRLQRVLDEIEALPQPTIAAISGHALGGGCEFAMACDFRIMSGGTIGLTEVSLGLIPGAGGTQRMTRLLGVARATELIFLAKRLGPQEAQRMGLVHKVVHPEHLMDEAMAFATTLSEGAVGAMGLAKRCIRAAFGSMEAGLEQESDAFAAALSSREAKEGISAFFAKRKPNFGAQV